MNRIETKASIEANDAGEITAQAWLFAEPDRVGDVIAKGAFIGAIGPIPMLFGHNPDDPIGVWEAIEESDEGLVVKGRLFVDTVARARETHVMLKAGILSVVSIGFRASKPVIRRLGNIGRLFSGVNLLEISLVTVPSHPGARVLTAKNAANAIADAINRAAVALAHKE